MFEVIEKETGKRLTVYAVDGDRFLVGAAGDFKVRHMAEFSPVMREDTNIQDKAEFCTFSTIQHGKPVELDKLLAGIASGEIPVDLGSTVSIRLLDGTEVDLVVTDQDEKTVRFESRDCLGINTSARGLGEYLEKVYALLPDALKKRIVEVERAHLDSDGERYTERGKLFVPAASEIFPSEDCYGDDGLYEQMEWYKDVHNRVRTDRKGGDSHWYWTGSPYSSDSGGFCWVSSGGGANYGGASNTGGLAPFGCIISKT